jgi:hypothetical protein
MLLFPVKCSGSPLSVIFDLHKIQVIEIEGVNQVAIGSMRILIIYYFLLPSNFHWVSFEGNLYSNVTKVERKEI